MEFLTSFPEVGPYSYVSGITSGALAGAWKAINKQTQEFYAIKSISKSSFTSAEQHTKFTAEIAALKQANNRYIAALIDLIDDPSTYHVVIELPEGESLRDHIAKHGPLSDKAVKEMVARLQYVLVYLNNELGMKYAILNPDTVFVDETGHLTRFILQINDSVLCPMNDISALCFSPPELLSRNICHRNSNSWGLGVMVLYALTGKIPFFASTKNDIIQAILNIHIEIPDTLPEEAQQFISRLLTKNPLMRIPIDDLFSSSFMLGVAKEVPSMNERRKSEMAAAPKPNMMGLVKTGSSTSLSGLIDHHESPSHVQPKMVHLSYKGSMKHSTSKNKLSPTSFG